MTAIDRKQQVFGCRFTAARGIDLRKPITVTTASLSRLRVFARCLALVIIFVLSEAYGERLEKTFEHPPDSAKPWTYWFWINGNITKEGITADLESMARVGIGGVLIMEVAKPGGMAPDGPVAFATPEWREMFKHVIAESKRLGLQVNMNNDAGWCGSGGPWITPEFSMQKLVSTRATLHGGQHIEQILPQPKALRDYYRDLKVLAFPAPERKKSTVPKDSVLDLTARMSRDGKLVWDAPEGEWQVLRIGCTTTGRVNKPSPKSGEGLECDKFNPEAVERHFHGFIAKLIADVGPEAAKVFTTTHIDSWEVGTQNWTPRMAEEFRQRRGYNLAPWLVVLAGGPSIGSTEETERFRRDFKRTQSELNDEAYAGALRKLANQRGLKLSIEAYNNGGFLNPLTYGAEADLPMSEFWIKRWDAWHLLSQRLMASVAHVYNRPVVGAESFTSTAQNDPFTEHPYSVKTTGDWAFCEGVNRFVFHRSVLHPWTNLVPGMSFAGYGWHVDRGQTWWEVSSAYMGYLARCQALLQQGKFVADICRLVPAGEDFGEGPGMATLPSHYEPIPVGFNYDYISDKAVLEELTVKKGRLITRRGMSYRMLQLPTSDDLTPQLLRKLQDLVKEGAIITGPKPQRSPSLEDYPQCDRQVAALASELWGDCDGRAVTEHKFGQGRVISGKPMADVLEQLAGGADFSFVIDRPATPESLKPPTRGLSLTRTNEAKVSMPTPRLNWIHRRIDGDEVYFLANPQYRAVNALCTFRVHGLQPELWDPNGNEIFKLATFAETPLGTKLPLHFGPADSVFVVFRHAAKPKTHIVEVRHDGDTIFSALQRLPAEVPHIATTDAETVLHGGRPGAYSLTFASGEQLVIKQGSSMQPVALKGPWMVRLQSGRGAPTQAEFAELLDWSTHTDEGIRHFSGTAIYSKEFDWASGGDQTTRWLLDLGKVNVIADVSLNGKNVGVLWKPPFVVDVTHVLKRGENQLEIKVTNLWPNRLIGDEQFPDDCSTDGRWKNGPIPAWPEWLMANHPRPEPRRITFTTWKYYSKDSPLLPSGLSGPVVLRPEAVASVARPSTENDRSLRNNGGARPQQERSLNKTTSQK